MSSNSRILQKAEISVEIALDDGEVLKGKLFVSPQSRITEVLNDERAFLPFKTSDGTLVALAKSSIRRVTLPAANAAAAPYRGNDAYKILGVPVGVGREELKKVYHQLCKQNHPDHVRGLGLGPDFVEVAEKCMSRINGAYAEVLKKFDTEDAALTR